MAKQLYEKLKSQGKCRIWEIFNGESEVDYYRIVKHDGIRYYLTHSYRWRLTESRSGGAVGSVEDTDAQNVEQVIRDLVAQVPSADLVEAAVAKALAEQG